MRPEGEIQILERGLLPALFLRYAGMEAWPEAGRAMHDMHAVTVAQYSCVQVAYRDIVIHHILPRATTSSRAFNGSGDSV